MTERAEDSTQLPQDCGRSLDDYVDLEQRAPEPTYPAFGRPPWWAYVTVIVVATATIQLTGGL